MDFGMNFLRYHTPSFYQDRNEEDTVCAPPNIVPNDGVWHEENLLRYSLPLLILQIASVVLLTRLLHVLLKPLHQPRIISEIIVGVLLGPSGLGQIKSKNHFDGDDDSYPIFWSAMFPVRGLYVLETVGNVGVIYYVFLVGIETDISVIKRTGRKALYIALASIGLSFLVSFVAVNIFGNHLVISVPRRLGINNTVMVLGVLFNVTAFPLIARILTEHKLLNTEFAQVAMSSAIIVDIFSWIVLFLPVTIKTLILYNNVANHGYKLHGNTPLYVFMWSCLFVLFCIYVARPIIIRRIERNPGSNDNALIVAILTGVMTCALITELIGINAISGAFMLGLIIPNGPLAVALVEKLEDFMYGLLLPIFFVITGLRTNINFLRMNLEYWKYLVGVIVVNSVLRVGVISLIAFYQKMQFHEQISLGLLMNTKGFMQLVILHIARDRKLINGKAFTVMVLSTLLTTSIISPLVRYVYKHAKGSTPYNYRTFQRLAKTSWQLRILACVHMTRQVAAIINLLETSNPSNGKPIGVCALHLVELSGDGASAMLTAHSNFRSNSGINSKRAQSEHISKAFQRLQNLYGSIHVQNLTTASPYSSMHKNISSIAEEKRTTLIILPFHKQQTVDGGMEVTNLEHRKINQNVLVNAPCTVGILIDRGLATAANQNSHNIAMLFFGGPDDREALTYAERMGDHPSVRLTVVRFLPGDNVDEVPTIDDSDYFNVFDIDKERKIDSYHIQKFRERTSTNKSIDYIEAQINNVAETVQAIRSIDVIHDFFIVGREPYSYSPLTAGLNEWCECPELGVIGDLLVSSDFGGKMSVLIISCYAGTGVHNEDGYSSSTPDSEKNDSRWILGSF